MSRLKTPRPGGDTGGRVVDSRSSVALEAVGGDGFVGGPVCFALSPIGARFSSASALVPGERRALVADRRRWQDVLLVCPGIVYRRDRVDRLHTGTPPSGRPRARRVIGGDRPRLAVADLDEMIGIVVRAARPGRATASVAGAPVHRRGSADRWVGRRGWPG